MFYRCIADVLLLQDVIRVHMGVQSRVIVREVATGNIEAMRTLLREMRQQRISKFFVHLSFSDTALFLKAVNSVLFWSLSNIQTLETECS